MEAGHPAYKRLAPPFPQFHPPPVRIWSVYHDNQFAACRSSPRVFTVLSSLVQSLYLSKFRLSIEIFKTVCYTEFINDASERQNNMVNLGNEWDALLAREFEQEYYRRLRYFLKKEYDAYSIYPPMQDIFNALRYTSYAGVKAVLLGQD